MVAGLLSLVGDASYAFEVPSSRYIVFNPVELLFNSLKKCGTLGNVGAYGVDPIRARVLFEGILSDVLRYGLKPLSILPGIPSTPSLGLKSVASRCFKMKKHYRKADFDVVAAKYRQHGGFFPCSRQFVTKCLRDMDLHCMQSRYDSIPVCLGIAYCLDCPVASMSSQYYVMARPTILPEELRSLAINELKIVDLNTDFYCVDDEGSKAVLKLKVFHPEMSALRRVPATSRPLLALLMNSTLLPKLPASFQVETVGSESYTSAKLRAVIKWVEETNPIYVLRAIMESVTDPKCMDYISGKILLYLKEFCPDFAEASDILKVLDLGRRVPAVKAPMQTVKEEEEEQRQRSSSPMFFFQTAAKMLKGFASPDRFVDFLYRWPAAIAHLYRSNMLEKVFIVALYCEFGVFLSYASDYLVELPCVYGPSRVLRYAHYCLIRGVEEANGLASKLVGLRPHAKEICYEGNFCYKTYMMEVRSMHLPRNCSVDDFIHAFIGLDCRLDVPEWSAALALSCILWHQQKVEHRNCDVAECALVLSVLVLAVATHFNMECGVLAVADHYDALKSLVVTKMEESGACASPAVEKELIHSVLELMVVYDHYVSLCRLLTALQEDSGIPDFSSAAYNRYPPNYAVFPSLALVVHMAAHLRCEETPSAVATRLWVVNALLRTTNDANDVARLKNAVTVFSTLVKFMSHVKLNLTAPKVAVGDPPSYFLPTKERLLLKRFSHSRGNAFLLRPSGNNKGRPPQTRNALTMNGGSYASRLTKRIERMRLNS
ncbi:expressed conserved protein [Echinococcus multilocularis]|uniref:Expressed conserved protein n=1 Tax=Echinococcus multilocularis TaxID=6211 RepID=A0A087VXR2_ECHMU|nr:expressed conserved protein [Echinococcus multilocularis]